MLRFSKIKFLEIILYVWIVIELPYRRGWRNNLFCGIKIVSIQDYKFGEEVWTNCEVGGGNFFSSKPKVRERKKKKFIPRFSFTKISMKVFFLPRIFAEAEDRKAILAIQVLFRNVFANSTTRG